MATTLTNLETVRHVLRGVSGPQPLAGTAQRAADAYAAMSAAVWTESDDGPSVPPHHFDTKSPMPGDAYRQTWGYDKSARTERSACGAVCYTVRIPADALSGAVCGVASVSAMIIGDRYLECGAVLTAMLSDDPAPPVWDTILEDGVSTDVLLAATSAEADVAPNKRTDKSATALLPIGEPAATYLHLVLRVADYLAVREAWHEGGAMLDPSTISVTFSRDVAPDAANDYPLFWQEILEGGAYIRAMDSSAAFAIAAPCSLWQRSFAGSAATPWTASVLEIRELLDGMRQPLPIMSRSHAGDTPSGHAVIPYGDTTQYHPAFSDASGNTGTVWAGYKLVTIVESGISYKYPEQHVAAAIYPVTGMQPMSFGRLAAPAVAIGSALSLRLLAYRVASRPPLPTGQDVYGAEVANPDELLNGYPVPSKLDCARLLFGGGTSLAFVTAASKYQCQPQHPGADLVATVDAPISLLGSWIVNGSIAAGTEYVFNVPLDVDGYAGLMLLAVPIRYAPASAADDVYVDWPLSGWSLRPR